MREALPFLWGVLDPQGAFPFTLADGTWVNLGWESGGEINRFAGILNLWQILITCFRAPIAFPFQVSYRIPPLLFVRLMKRQFLPPEVNRVLYVRNLPFRITGEEMYDIFGRFGAIRQIRLGDAPDTRGTAFVVYEDIYDAKKALESLSNFSVAGRFLKEKMQQRLDRKKKEAEAQRLRDYISKHQQQAASSGQQ